MKIENLKLPSLMDDPEYMAAQTKYIELQTNLAAAQKRRDTILNQLNGEGESTPRPSLIVSAALKLIGRSGAFTPAASAASLRQELSEVTENWRILLEAVSMQKGFLAELRGKVSKGCIENLLPAHREMVREIANCALALDAALSVEYNFREELFQRDIVTSEVRWMPLPGFGRTRDSNSRISAWLIEACEYGFLEIKEIPECLRTWAKAKMAKPTPAAPTPHAQANIDGWVNA